MNYIKLFENFQREQPLEKQDIINLLEGTGISYTDIYELPIIYKKGVYLSWMVICDNPEDYIYRSPRNYEVYIKGERGLYFIWMKVPDLDLLLSKYFPDRWKEVKEYLELVFSNLDPAIENNDLSLGYYKGDNHIITFQRNNNEFHRIWLNRNVWDKIEFKFGLGLRTWSFFNIYLHYLILYINKFKELKNIELSDKFDIKKVII